MAWQYYRYKWHWPWHTSSLEFLCGQYYFSHFAGVGPFQFHWYSKSRWW